MWKNYIATTSVEETLEHLMRFGKQARLIAGATDLMLEFERGLRKEVATVIDVSRIHNKNFISIDNDKNIHMGFLTTHNDCVASKILREFAYPLVQACWEVGSPQIRNRGTIVGNLVTASPANDTISPLMAMNARVVLQSQHSTRTVPLQDFYLGVRRTVMQPEEMMTEIIFPALEKNQTGYFIKFALRKAQAISLVNITTILQFVDGIIQDAKITLGAVAPVIIHADEAEKFLLGKRLDEETIQIAAKLALESSRPISDIRGSAAYRKTMVKVLTKKTLLAIKNFESQESLPENPIVLATPHAETEIEKVEFTPSYCEIETTINGKKFTTQGGVEKSLLRFLREDMGMIGTKEGCAEGECGSCTVFLDGKAVMACLVPAGRAHKAEIITIEGLTVNGENHIVQQAFIEEGAVQCGYCTPGFIMSAAKLLQEKATPSQQEIRYAISGNLCRCTGYYKIISAIEKAADFTNHKEISNGKV